MKLYEFDGPHFTKNDTCSDQPDGIIGCLGKSYFLEKGCTPEALHADMMALNDDDDGYWCMTIGGIPKIEVPYYYMVFDGKVQYRLDILSFNRNTSHAFQREGYIRRFGNKNWVYLGGRVIKAPSDFLMRGFQGFRYCKLIF